MDPLEWSPYNLYCSVCKNSFVSFTEWIDHLPGIGHQRKARLACRRWNKAKRNCVLVAFGSCRIECCDLPRRLSRRANLVTDFIFWRKRPNVGLLQFESREKLEEVLKRTDSEIVIDDVNRVQLKRAVDYLELEWNVLLKLKADGKVDSDDDEIDNVGQEVKEEQHTEYMTTEGKKKKGKSVKCRRDKSDAKEKKTKKRKKSASNEDESTGCGNKKTELMEPPKKKKKKKVKVLDTSNLHEQDTILMNGSLNGMSSPSHPDEDCNNEDEIIILSSDSETEESVVKDNDEVMKMSWHVDGISLKNDNKLEYESQDSINSRKSKLSELLQQQQISLFQNIMIPSDRYDAAMLLVSMLENEFKKTVPSCRVIPFRHWYLGIENCGNNELLLFLDYRQIWEQDEWVQAAATDTYKPPIINTFLGYPDTIFPDIKKLEKQVLVQNMNWNDQNQNEERYGVGFIHEPTGIKFRIICSTLLLCEVQTCLLVQYLCQFDLNVLPLLGLVNYWANLNAISVGNFRITNPANPRITPLPATLDWLVLLFLTNRKVIPSVRSVLSKPHRKIIVSNHWFVDIGFSNDSKFPKMWSSISTQPLKIHEQIERIKNTKNDDFYNAKNMLHLLELLKQCFEFYSSFKCTQNRKQTVVFNTKDGNVIRTPDIINSHVDNKVEMLLNEEELESLKTLKYLTEQPSTILHPIHPIKYSLSFCGNKFSYLITHAMSRTAKKIGSFLRNIENTVSDVKNIDIVDLLKVNLFDLDTWIDMKGEKVLKRKTKNLRTKKKQKGKLDPKKRKIKRSRKISSTKSKVKYDCEK